MPGVARLGDSISHGGEITSASPDVLCNGILVARVGDMVHCHIHGLQHITSGVESVQVNGRTVAVIGSGVSCGAHVTTGSFNVIAGD